MSRGVFQIRERKQGFWRSLVEPTYEVFAEGEVGEPLIVASEGGAGASSRRIRLSMGPWNGGGATTYWAEESGIGPSGAFVSFLITAEATGEAQCLIVPPALAKSDVPLMRDEDRGYPAFHVVGEGDARWLASSNGASRLARLHRPWRDSERARGVVGSFETEAYLEPDCGRLVLLAATVETLRDWESPNVVSHTL